MSRKLATTVLATFDIRSGKKHFENDILVIVPIVGTLKSGRNSREDPW